MSLQTTMSDVTIWEAILSMWKGMLIVGIGGGIPMLIFYFFWFKFYGK